LVSVKKLGIFHIGKLRNFFTSLHYDSRTQILFEPPLPFSDQPRVEYNAYFCLQKPRTSAGCLYQGILSNFRGVCNILAPFILATIAI